MSRRSRRVLLKLFSYPPPTTVATNSISENLKRTLQRMLHKTKTLVREESAEVAVKLAQQCETSSYSSSTKACSRKWFTDPLSSRQICLSGRLFDLLVLGAFHCYTHTSRRIALLNTDDLGHADITQPTYIFWWIINYSCVLQLVSIRKSFLKL